MKRPTGMYLYSKTIHVKYKGYDIYALKLKEDVYIQKVIKSQKVVYTIGDGEFEQAKFPFTIVGISKFF